MVAQLRIHGKINTTQTFNNRVLVAKLISHLHYRRTWVNNAESEADAWLLFRTFHSTIILKSGTNLCLKFEATCQPSPGFQAPTPYFEWDSSFSYSVMKTVSTIGYLKINAFLRRRENVQASSGRALLKPWGCGKQGHTPSDNCNAPSFNAELYVQTYL